MTANQLHAYRRLQLARERARRAASPNALMELARAERKYAAAMSYTKPYQEVRK